MRYLRRVADLSEIGLVNGTLIGYTHLSMKDSDTFSMSVSPIVLSNVWVLFYETK